MSDAAFDFGRLAAALNDAVDEFFRRVNAGMAYQRSTAAAERARSARMLAEGIEIERETRSRRLRMAAWDTTYPDPAGHLAEMTGRHRAEAVELARRYGFTPLPVVIASVESVVGQPMEPWQIRNIVTFWSAR